VEPAPEQTAPAASLAADRVVDDPAPPPPDGGATRLADEMLAMFSDPEPGQPVLEESPPEVPTQQPDPSASFENPERPSAEIDPADELLHDPMITAEEESKRRWFNR
jgi:hypothetical protein